MKNMQGGLSKTLPRSVLCIPAVQARGSRWSPKVSVSLCTMISTCLDCRALAPLAEVATVNHVKFSVIRRSFVQRGLDEQHYCRQSLRRNGWGSLNCGHV